MKDIDQLNALVLNNPQILSNGKLIDFRFTDYLLSEGVKEGWFELVYGFLKEISKKHFVDILQIKEKFGTLRIYVMSDDEEVYNIAVKYEKESAKTCLTCGKPGSLTNKSHGYWLLTLCDEHKKQYKQQNGR